MTRCTQHKRDVVPATHRVLTWTGQWTSVCAKHAEHLSRLTGQPARPIR